jgi:hypothetical protein
VGGPEKSFAAAFPDVIAVFPVLCKSPGRSQCGNGAFFHTFANSHEALDNG